MVYKSTIKTNIFFICSNIDLSISGDKVTGQSVITDYVYSFLCEKYKINLILNRTHNSNIFLIFFNFFSFIFKIFFSLNNYKFAYIVISRSRFGFIRDALIIISLLLKKIPVIIHIHGSDILKVKEYSIIHKFLFLILKFTINIVPSNTLKQNLNQINIDSKYISNFSSVYPLNKKSIVPHKKEKNEIKLLWNSNILYSKGFYHLAEALLRIYKNGFSNFRLVILGRTLTDKYMKSVELDLYLNEFKKYPFVEYIGPVSNDKAYKYLFDSDIVCLPSFYPTECQPLSIIDAIVANKYLLISDNKYLLELTKDCERTIFNIPLDISCMYHEIQSLFCTSDSNIFDNINNKHISKFEKEYFQQNLESIFRDLK